MPAGAPFGLAAGFLDGGGAGLRGAALGPFPAGSPARALDFGLIRRGFVFLGVLRLGRQRFGDGVLGVLGLRYVGWVVQGIGSCSVTATPPGGRARCGWPAPAVR